MRHLESPNGNKCCLTLCTFFRYLRRSRKITALSFEPSLALFLSSLHFSRVRGESIRFNTLKIDVTPVVVTLKGFPKVHLPILNYI